MQKLNQGGAWLLPVLMTAFCSVAHAELKTLPGHVPPAVARLTPVGRLAGDRRLNLAIGLPLRDQAGLDKLLRGLYDPAGTNFHHYLTPPQFTERFGPSASDYQAVVDFARTNGLAITHTHGNRVLLDVSGRAADVERAFHITLRTYRHPVEAREFYAPDKEPTVAASLPVLDISGLSDYAKMRPMLHVSASAGAGASAGGSGPVGTYLGLDFRNAYVPGTTLDGSGQMVGLVEFDGYDPADIAAYEARAGLPNVPVLNIQLDGFDGSAGAGEAEVCLDIEMAISMATNAAQVVVFEAANDPNYWNDILNAMASSNQIRQFSSSWGYEYGTNYDLFNICSDEIFKEMAAQGQSFFQASGDGDAWTNPIWRPADSPYVTSVGGTTLAMTNSGGAYVSENVWNLGYNGTNGWSQNGNGYVGSGGGVSAVYHIPSWQTNVNMAANQGSATMRNIPDVALIADNIYVAHGSGVQDIFGGTSCAAPLWAGFMALVNEQAAILGRPSAGFINPAIYALAGTTNYNACFHDITVGSNAWSGSPNVFYAVPGYDLCTGLGTPAGTNLIAALAATSTFDSQQLVRDGGFETSYFTDWVLYGNGYFGGVIYNGVVSPYEGYDPAHSGYFWAILGDTSLAILQQALPTSPGRKYLLSFWFDNPSTGAGQVFEVNWNTNGLNTNTIYSVISPPAFSWSNLNYVVAATSTNTTLQFGAANPPNYFGLDDVGVTLIPTPNFSSVAAATNGIALTWTALANVGYLVQYSASLSPPAWQALGGSVTATNRTFTLVDTNFLAAPAQRFYRVSVWP
jgi:hypothetical protein